MSNTIKRPTCAGCPHDLYFGEPIPKRQQGVMMHLGEHYCTGSKRARRFRKSDPKVYAPSWCPKRKDPCELRIYGFKDDQAALMHYLSLGSDPDDPLHPMAYRYTVKHRAKIKLTPREFWEQCQTESCLDLLGTEVPLYSIVEIDDGLAPAFFYSTTEGMKITPYFDPVRTRKNSKEGAD